MTAFMPPMTLGVLTFQTLDATGSPRNHFDSFAPVALAVGAGMTTALVGSRLLWRSAVRRFARIPN